MKIAIVHDWLNTVAGAEKVVREIIYLFPDADVYCLFDFLDDTKRNNIVLGKKTHTSFLQRIPFFKQNYQKSLALFPFAIESLDLSKYDLIISSSHAVAKGILTKNHQLHICYCHTPMRYVWDLRSQYLEKMPFLKRIIVNSVLEKIKKWDLKSATNVNFFIANSHFVSNRIAQFYNRESVVIHPPVNINDFQLQTHKKDFFVTASRFVPYKKVDIIIKAFNLLPEQKLIVIGDGEQKHYLKSIAHKNIEFIHNASDEVLKYYLQNAKAFIYAAIEDFGILPVEAQACGTPVIAYKKGGILETVQENQTGYFYEEQNEHSLREKILYFLSHNHFDAETIKQHTELFSDDIFRQKISAFVKEKWNEFKVLKL